MLDRQARRAPGDRVLREVMTVAGKPGFCRKQCAVPHAPVAVGEVRDLNVAGARWRVAQDPVKAWPERIQTAGPRATSMACEQPIRLHTGTCALPQVPAAPHAAACPKLTRDRERERVSRQRTTRRRRRTHVPNGRVPTADPQAHAPPAARFPRRKAGWRPSVRTRGNARIQAVAAPRS